MKTMRIAVLAPLLAALAMLGTACSRPAQPSGPLVLAAASLQEGLSEAADLWAAQGHPRPVLSFAASSALARQVIAGAPADLFISADAQWMDELAGRGMIVPDSRTILARNRLVLIAPWGRAVQFSLNRDSPLAAALGDGRLAMADPDSVPAGRYGKAALTHLGLWEPIADRVVPAENVRAALALVARGEAVFGIVYASDARSSQQVRIVDSFPADSHPPIVYPMAQLAASTHPDARALLDFLATPQVQRMMATREFLAP